MEDYEKKYKEALERAKQWRNAPNVDKIPTFANRVIDEIFPELKESEDEKIRKRVLFSLQKDFMATKNSGCNTQDLEQCIAWLEKQGINYSIVEEIKKRKDSFIREKEKAVSSNDKLSLGARIAMLEELLVFVKEKQGERKSSNVDYYQVDDEVGNLNDWVITTSHDKVEPIFSIGDVLCDKSCTTLSKESQSNIKILDIRNGLYICNNCIFPIEQQDEYELVSKKIEQKSADSVKTKFKIGDWIVGTLGGYYKVIAIEQEYNTGKYDYILLEPSGNDTSYDKEFVDEHFHRWTIQDAKEGDVLAAEECYVIFKEIDGLNIKCYCTYHYMGFNPSFHINTLQNKTAFHPATKEQCDLLFTKMKEAGWKWNADKKELKKIEKKPAWSEEDEEMTKELIEGFLSSEKTHHLVHTSKEIADWLKSVKCRMKGKEE